MALKVGARLRARNSSCEVVVVKGSEDSGVLLCGGIEMAGSGAESAKLSDGPKVMIGKRYADKASGVEVLCTKSGIGPLTYAGRELMLLIEYPAVASLGLNCRPDGVTSSRREVIA